MEQSIKYQNEFSLLQHFRDGDLKSFALIYDTHYRPLFHFATRLTKDSNQAEDIIADCFVIIWQKRLVFKTYKGLVAFMYTCTRNACISFILKERRHSASHKEIKFLSNQQSLGTSAEEIKEDLIQCSIIESEKLPLAMKRIFQLLYIDGFTTSEIAEKLHLSVNTVRAQRTNAINRVRENLLKKGLLSWLF